MSKKKEENVGMLYLEELSSDTRYSLSVDPENQFKLDAEHKQFIELYSQYNNLAVVCELMNIELHLGKDYLLRYSTQHELRRLNLARYHRQIATQIIAYQDLGSFLSSWLIGDSITESDKLKKSEKMQLVKLLMDWHKGMREFEQNPAEIIDMTIEEELSELKATDIRELLQKKKLISTIKKAKNEIEGIEDAEIIEEPKTKEEKLTKKQMIERVIEHGNFEGEEAEFVKSLTIKELREILK